MAGLSGGHEAARLGDGEERGWSRAGQVGLLSPNGKKGGHSGTGNGWGRCSASKGWLWGPAVTGCAQHSDEKAMDC